MLAAIGNPFIPTWQALAGYQLRPFAAELILVGTIVAVLLSPFFSVRRSNVISGLVALAGLILSLVALISVRDSGAGPQFVGMLVSDGVAIFWKAILLVFAIGVVLMWFSTVAPRMHEGDGPEFFTLLLGATLGMCLMGSTANLLMIVIAVEMASLPSYVLAGFRKTDSLGSEASLKYVLFGAATSSIMIYGMSWLYGTTGTLDVPQIASWLRGGMDVPTIVALIGVFAGIGFKISAVPFHFWCPDVFQGAGTDVAAFLSVASKGAGMTLLLRIVMDLAGGSQFQASNSLLVGIAVAIGVVGSVTATVGNTAAYFQENIKRLLAYSSIAHAGYMLCALSLVIAESGQAGLAQANSAAAAILLYLAVYLFMNLGAFTVAAMIARESGSEDLEAFRGLGRRNPLAAACMSAFLFSLVGLPPFAGFMAKLNVMVILGQGGGWWWALVGVIGLNTIFSLYYYARVIRAMYLTGDDRPSLRVSPLGAGLSLTCAVMLILMLVAFSPVQRLTSRYGRLYHPEAAAGSASAATAVAHSSASR